MSNHPLHCLGHKLSQKATEGVSVLILLSIFLKKDPQPSSSGAKVAVTFSFYCHRQHYLMTHRPGVYHK